MESYVCMYYTIRYGTLLINKNCHTYIIIINYSVYRFIIIEASRQPVQTSDFVPVLATEPTCRLLVVSPPLNPNLGAIMSAIHLNHPDDSTLSGPCEIPRRTLSRVLSSHGANRDQADAILRTVCTTVVRPA
jgi:hypothetical protein